MSDEIGKRLDDEMRGTGDVVAVLRVALSEFDERLTVRLHSDPTDGVSIEFNGRRGTLVARVAPSGIITVESRR